MAADINPEFKEANAAIEEAALVFVEKIVELFGKWKEVRPSRDRAPRTERTTLASRRPPQARAGTGVFEAARRPGRLPGLGVRGPLTTSVAPVPSTNRPPIAARGPWGGATSSGHRLCDYRHPLVHGDEEPRANSQHEQCVSRLGHDRPPRSAPARDFLRFDLGSFVACAGDLPFKVARSLPQAGDVAGTRSPRKTFPRISPEPKSLKASLQLFQLSI